MDRYKKKSGQHTMEYVIMLTLIMAALLVMGPYVIRSWNAQMKGWEDTMIDSLQDPLKESNDEIDISMCECTDWINDYNLCGASCPVLSRVCKAECRDVELLLLRTCVPPGCEIFDENNPKRDLLLGICEVNDCCCTNPQEIPGFSGDAGCGANINVVDRFEPCLGPLGPLGLGREVPVPWSPFGTGNLVSTIPRSEGGMMCPDGTRGVYTHCGGDDQTSQSEARFGCIADLNCVFKCDIYSAPLTTGSLDAINILGKQLFCSDTDLGLIQKENRYAAINEEDSCDTTGNINCQIKCIRPFEVDSTGTACVCPLGYETSIEGNRCVCPINSVDQGGCSMNQCEQATICPDGSSPTGKCFR